MEALEINRAIGEIFGYRLVSKPSYTGGDKLMFYIEHNGKQIEHRDDWLITEEVAWQYQSPNWAFSADQAVKLITGNSHFNIQMQLTGCRVIVQGTDVDIERKTFAHAVCEAWYMAMISETV